MSQEYFINLIQSDNRNEVQIFDTNGFTLINSVNFGNSRLLKAIWVKGIESQDELIGLITTSNTFELLHISPIIGITERATIEQTNVTDICYFQDSLYACFDGGIINLTSQKISKLNKPIKQIVAGDKIYASDGSKVYEFNRGKLKQIKEFDDVKSMKYVDGLVVFTSEGAVINDQLAKAVTNIASVNDQVFLFRGNTVIVNEIEIKTAKNHFVDVIHGEDGYRFIYKTGSSVNSKNLELRSQTVDFSSSNGTHRISSSELDIDLDALMPQIHNLSSEVLIKKINKLTDTQSRAQLLELIETNDDEANIKTTISKLSKDTQLVLMTAIISRISKNPIESISLSLWFKHLVLVDSSVLGQISHTKLATASKRLAGSLQLLPELLSIKGKLNLMSTQQEFKAMRFEPEAFENHQEDESLVIVNGENDDDDSVVEALPAGDDDNDDDDEF
ncbi:hypothetical protein PSN45_002737 [Yamadazyma tenuis]|uniref:Small-subunit processome Utp12 domain-containing protein n=1 Tax=Candida tenuis (strain ATCC 10573 / BCRC 21748 / CBS 615 / JCM 9827 / NBRC 10315 / NRRL Y-1498 / VKM Y-70) TaxID=590646 RepID=G3AWZ1_CANTC|nr:uncharacterized protein CANTEDRAFT_112367 [Yamadazyma tenuis ATCC 10573]XP_006684121.1 uncharacterized protein CANTEDRAFT_112367 [Yamadazyma tenuis ATCC 10573]EGV66862.1 hypothetical protein CANTEDRAFT_112367 [Yamadazyma tenuis ATCC 10573]EGV66863.1 hypothetical protein CANTEDRAFT_112367 [Yamadazyma tenuis ATCC 10573]WEJ95224.1 hypothetical protein PSN45_002737 [Yamadazyma tenuis]